MLPRPGFLLVVVATAVGCNALGAAPRLFAQTTSAQAAPQTVRYHFGDDPGWASPDIDDGSWPVARQEQWPRPGFHSDGFVWVRFRIPVRFDTAEPLSLRVGSLERVLAAYEVFVNGTRVGEFGHVPPEPSVESLPRNALFDLPQGLARPGEAALVTLRVWYPPFARQAVGLDSTAFTFDQSRTLHAEELVVREQALVRNYPAIILYGLILLTGLVVLVLGSSSRSRDLLLYGALLASFPFLTLYLELIDSRLLSPSSRSYFLCQVLSQLPAMITTIEFIWRLYDLKDIWLKRFAYAALVIFNVGVLATFLPMQPSGLVPVARVCLLAGLNSFDLLTLGANLWVLFIKPRRRLTAVAMSFVPVASLIAGFRDSFQGGAGIFDLAFFLSGLCLSAILALQAWREWRARDSLQAEFETAREMQQRLVPPAADLPGYRIESVYKPARHVGGDFFYIRPVERGGLLVVVGDVSGKGLKAAMTVNLVIGALRTMPPLPPTRILAALNRGLAGQMQGGFVTCCAVRVDPNGAATIANAGHLSPYHNGAEIPVIAGLPLGIDPSVDYEESQFAVLAADSLTFVSDGIIEARNASGELFGFDRTLQLSNSGARAIAQAAVDFGQDDDITVLTVTRESTEQV